MINSESVFRIVIKCCYFGIFIHYDWPNGEHAKAIYDFNKFMPFLLVFIFAIF